MVSETSPLLRCKLLTEIIIPSIGNAPSACYILSDKSSIHFTFRVTGITGMPNPNILALIVSEKSAFIRTDRRTWLDRLVILIKNIYALYPSASYILSDESSISFTLRVTGIILAKTNLRCVRSSEICTPNLNSLPLIVSEISAFIRTGLIVSEISAFIRITDRRTDGHG